MEEAKGSALTEDCRMTFKLLSDRGGQNAQSY
jgi:hypothetical protein